LSGGERKHIGEGTRFRCAPTAVIRSAAIAWRQSSQGGPWALTRRSTASVLAGQRRRLLCRGSAWCFPASCVPAEAELLVSSRSCKLRCLRPAHLCVPHLELSSPAIVTQAWTIRAYCRIERCGCARKRLGSQMSDFQDGFSRSNPCELVLYGRPIPAFPATLIGPRASADSPASTPTAVS
jgi:hypothetical protein